MTHQLDEPEQKELTDRTVFLVVMGVIVFVITLVTVAAMVTAMLHNGGASKSDIDAFMAARLKGSEAQIAPACPMAMTNMDAAAAMFQNTNSHYSGEDLAKAFVRWCAAHPEDVTP